MSLGVLAGELHALCQALSYFPFAYTHPAKWPRCGSRDNREKLQWGQGWVQRKTARERNPGENWNLTIGFYVQGK